MKKNILLIFFVLCAKIIYSQSIPNYDFEDWVEQIPQEWKATNSQQVYLHYDQDNNNTLAIESKSANPQVSAYLKDAEIEIRRNICSNDCDARPQALIFDYQFSGDEFSAEIILKNNNKIVGKGYFSSSKENEVWQEAEVKIEYLNDEIPNKVDIYFTSYTASENSNSVFIVDNLSYKNEILSSLSQEKEQILVFPNPAKDFLNIELNLPKRTPVKITLHNVIGAIIYETQEINLQQHDFEINLNNYRKGIYFVNFAIGNKSIVKKVIIR